MGSHLIHTQLLEANFQSKESALSGQKLLQERYREVLLPMMEQIFDAYEPIGRSLRIDKIELDLGRFPADLPENMIRDRLRHVLEDQFRKIYLEQGILTHPTHNHNQSPDNLSKSKHHSDWEKIICYLINGRMPWWGSSKEKEPVQLLFNRVTLWSDSSLKTWLKENPISLATAKRLAALLSEDQLVNLFKDNLHLSIKDLQTVNSLLSLLLSKTKLKKAEVRFWLNTAFLISIYGKRNGVSSFLETGFKDIKIAERNEALRTSQFLIFIGFFILKMGGRTTVSEMKASVSDFIQLLSSANQFWKKIGYSLRKILLEESDFSAFSKNILHLESQEKKTLESTSPELDELEIVSNAGLVLAAAFLPRFFQNLGLVKSGKFISEQTQIKAAIILQEMVPKHEYDETDLLLNKLLCGIPPASALGLIPKITPSEKKEIALLLESMATQWTALKSSSGKMIAEGFFRREGSLRRVQKGYQLQIQRLPFDMLLDRLPWTIGMIRLPWMDELISVEW